MNYNTIIIVTLTLIITRITFFFRKFIYLNKMKCNFTFKMKDRDKFTVFHDIYFHGINILHTEKVKQ